MTMRGLLATILATVGLGVGVIVCGIALDHNPQGEFRDNLTGTIDWLHLLSLGGASAVAAAVAASPVAALIVVGVKRWLRPTS